MNRVINPMVEDRLVAGGALVTGAMPGRSMSRVRRPPRRRNGPDIGASTIHREGGVLIVDGDAILDS
jgi:hypothetical protein